MQMSGSQIGMDSAMLRFSYRAVPVGNVPSTGSALDRQQVSLAFDHHRRDPLDEVGRVGRRPAAAASSSPAVAPGTLTSKSSAMAVSTPA